MLRVNMEYKKKILFVRLKGNLNEATSTCYLDYAIPIIKDYKIKYLVLNINNLSCLDENGYECIKTITNMVKNNHGKTLLIDKQQRDFNSELLALNIVAI